MDLRKTLVLWKARVQGYERAFARRPTTDVRFAELPAILDALAQTRALAPEEQRLRGFFKTWSAVRASAIAWLERLFP